MKKTVIGYYDDSVNRGGTVRYLTELLGALDCNRYTPVFFASKSRSWHGELPSLDERIFTLAPGNPASSAVDTAQTPRATPGTIAKRALRSCVPRKVAWSMGIVREVRSLRRLFSRYPVDLLHINISGTDDYAPVAARLAGVPRIIGTYHVSPSYDLNGTRNALRFRLIEKASMGVLNRAIACCDYVKEDWSLRHISVKRLMAVVHNGIDARRMERHSSVESARSVLGLPARATIIGTLAFLHPFKGLEHLLRSLALLIGEHPDAHVVIAGGGPLEVELKQLAASLAVAEHVTFLGSQNDVGVVFDAIDIYVQPSLVEAFPIALLEASAAGLPIVASAVGGIPEMIVDGETGLLAPAADARLLADALRQLLARPTLRGALGTAARKRIQSVFTAQIMAEKTSALYEEALACPEPVRNGSRVCY